MAYLYGEGGTFQKLVRRMIFDLPDVFTFHDVKKELNKHRGLTEFSDRQVEKTINKMRKLKMITSGDHVSYVKGERRKYYKTPIYKN